MKQTSTLSTQTNKYVDVAWVTKSDELQISETFSGTTRIDTPPSGRTAEMEQAYWAFDYEFSASAGLVLSDVIVKDSQGPGSVEHVFDRIDFADFAVGFTDGSVEEFSISRAYANPSSFYKMAEQGGAGADELFQRGIELTLMDNVLAHRGGRCYVSLVISVVFRGAKNDFDPGGVPFAMLVWPELTYSWSRDGATKTVSRFRGSVRVTVGNSMYAGHAAHGGVAPPVANVATFYSDTNAMGGDRTLRPGAGIRGVGGLLFLKSPFGWAQVFDYLAANVQQEREFVGVYGPGSGAKYSGGGTSRELAYRWPGPGNYPVIVVRKADRQGNYDNVHAHAQMPTNDSPCGNLQIHAPFCGHSCVHMHWRWSSVSSEGAPEDGWRYKGWSNLVAGESTAHSVANAPKVPPNQHVTIALCRPGTTRFDADHIINPVATTPLDPLYKLIYYTADIHDPRANERQVILNHGMGWAYRYSTPDESPPLKGLLFGVHDSLPWSGTPSQPQLARVFEEDIYPLFRYIGAIPGQSFVCTDQIPPGSHNVAIAVPWPTTRMEDL